jgi:uncharacterized protein
MEVNLMEFLTEVRWSPYVVGIGIGILSWFSFLISREPLACSTSFATASGMIEKLFSGKKVDLKPYYQKIGLAVDWQRVRNWHSRMVGAMAHQSCGRIQ